MQYQSFLIKYAEIGTKGKNRFMFEDALIKQIRFALREVDGSFEVTKESGRIYVTAEGDYDYEDTIEALKRVFGIADICPMVQIDDRDYENLKKHVVEYMDKVYPDKNLTFKVVARRGDKRYPVSSDQINRDMGEAILEAFPQMRVDVHNPDVLLRVEIRQKVNIFSLMIPVGRYACRHQRKGHASSFRRHRQSGGRLYDCKERRKNRCGLLPCAALHQRPCKAEGSGSGEAGSSLFRPHGSSCGEFYGYSAVYL